MNTKEAEKMLTENRKMVSVELKVSTVKQVKPEAPKQKDDKRFLNLLYTLLTDSR